MSMHRFTARKHTNGFLPIRSLLSGLLLAFLLAPLPAVSAFASATRAALDAPPEVENVARAGVSLVRVLSTYVTSDRHTIECTGLGVLVASESIPSGSTAQNDWVLTDGNLVNTAESVTCASQPHASGQLTAVKIILSKSYNPQGLSFSLATPVADHVHCLEKTGCDKGPALVSFNNTALSPFINVASGISASATSSTLGLTTSVTSLELPPSSMVDPPADAYEKSVQQFLTPVAPSSLVAFENGAPVVDKTGALIGLRLSSNTPVTPEIISLFLQANHLETQNTVHDEWDQGVTAYYEKNDPVTAHSAFQKVVSANPQFQGAQDFVQLTTTIKTTDRGQSTQTTAGPPNQQGGFTVPVINLPLPLWLVSIIALVVLVAIMLLTSLFIGRSRQRTRLQNEYEEAERRATIEAQRISEMESQPHAWDQPTVIPAPVGGVSASMIAQPGPSQAGASSVRTVSPAHTLRCPRCNEPVQSGANYCPNCRLLLSPSESGLHLKIVPQQIPPAPPPQVVPIGSIADQPTIDMSSADQPTIDMGSKSQPLLDAQVIAAATAAASNGEKTLPYTPARGKRLSPVVVTRTNPGIKRKFKPNEDSIFAGKGVRAGQPQLVGLFVVADGMGGHANGQNASRLAIQTIVDYTVPRLMQVGEEQTVDFKQLVIDGIQSANMAVHQQNLEQHADMGTTITAALVIEDSAYVANVGDSRTYLYREAVGLGKVTQDHSVVASLVEAGIIKPDDIYTHPKRNQIYRSLGEKPAVEVDAFVVQLQPGDKLLLCSDGLWDMVRDPKLEEVVKQSQSNLESLGDGLIQAAFDGGGEDNVSVIIVHMAEAAKRIGKAGFQLLAKPDGVKMPHL